MKYLFGPVNSRRLGISLGIDLIPYKTCSLDCAYCECGVTTDKTVEIKEYVPASVIINELNDYLSSKPELDIITFAGSGEPTLHSGIGEIINFLKSNYPEYKISVLTNSTLLYRKEVRKAIINADIIMPSLDAVSYEVFKKINRPHKDITIENIIKGLIELRKEFKNTIILEIFIAPGINDSNEELSLIKKVCEDIAPDMIQLNTLDRPGTEDWITPSTENSLIEIRQFLSPLKVDIIKKPMNREKTRTIDNIDITNQIIATVSRRPSTLEDLSNSLNINRKDALKTLRILVNKGIIEKEDVSRGTFYKIKK
ncbi:MAG: radical SAM protein [Spirochaetes bacterium]|nr:radical SAM protein [Spirochaetota bacterium]